MRKRIEFGQPSANFPRKIEKDGQIHNITKNRQTFREKREWKSKTFRTQNHLTTRIFSIHLLPQQLTGQCGRFQFL